MVALINYLTKVRFGHGAISVLKEELEALGVRAPLIVTDQGLVATGLVENVKRESGLGDDMRVFDGTPENPTEAAVHEALSLFNEAQCDGIVAVGGGSSIDLAKGVALLGTHSPPLSQYAAIEGGVSKIRADILPLVAVPTTAGTGSEVGRAALITLSDNHKVGFLSPYLIPSVAICDPELTRTLPPGLTAATGMDAIAHCIETLLSPRINPPAEAIALDGLGRATRNIRSAVQDGANMDVRSEMMMAALEGAMAFQKGLGAVHSMSHALGGFKELKLHHGTLNALLLPPVLRFNAEHCGDKYARIRQAMELDADANVAAAFERFNVDLDMPPNLRAMGVSDDILPQAAEWSYADHSTATNPRSATTDDFLHLLEEAMG